MPTATASPTVRPDATDATGDGADEDGISVVPLIRGTNVAVTVTSSGAGFLGGWVDFNADGDWDDAGEQVFTDQPVVGGANSLQIAVPAGATLGSTFARFRLTGTSGYSYNGLAPGGEVEDYQLDVTDPVTDFGDAPENGTSYPTTLANNGPRHEITGNTLLLGAGRDGEIDGQPTADASGDGADEDGVTLGQLDLGTTVPATVTSTAPGFLNGWVDFNRDGDWDDPDEQVFTDAAVVAGVNNLLIDVPESASAGVTFARFRLAGAAGHSYFGLAPDGEVEDYQVTIIDPDEEPGPEADDLIEADDENQGKVPIAERTQRLWLTLPVAIERFNDSMSLVAQIFGRGTRINEDDGHSFFTIMDFKKATELSADPDVDDPPDDVYQPEDDAEPIPPDDLWTGRRLDFQSLRHTSISNLARADVHQRKTQQLVRHSTIDLTMNVYTHPGLADAAAELDKPPALPNCEAQSTRATGTDDSVVAPMVAQPADISGDSVRSIETRSAADEPVRDSTEVDSLQPIEHDCEPLTSNRAGRTRTCNQRIMSPLL